MNIVGHVAARIIVDGLGARALGCRVLVGGHLVAVCHNGCELRIGLLTTDGHTRSHGGVVEAVPCVKRIIAATLGQ